MTTALRAAALEVDVHLGDVEGNLGRIRAAIERGAASGARLLVLPELATSGYVFDDAAEAAHAALTRDDPRLDALRDVLPAGVVAVLGYLERDGDVLYNSAVVLTRDAIVGTYRKAHLWDRESELFEVGDSAGAVYDTPIGRVGVAICYDNEFPEVPRALALAGADVLALPVNWPLVPRPDGEHAPEVIQAMGSARSSRLPTVIADRVGSERGVAWTGGTTVIDGDGWIAAVPDDGVALADLTLMPGDKALSPRNDLFGDRRPDLY
ncbi:MAG: carbon-nitrogen hydrolase [Agromyces sp.]|nr:carbon-nitrogen hydrolase [Agromyces sp.]